MKLHTKVVLWLLVAVVVVSTVAHQASQMP
jgi:hypothetical protein